MKKALILLLTAAMLVGVLVTGAAAAGEPTLAVSSAIGYAGDTVDLTIRLVNNPGVASLNLTAEYDADSLEWIGVRQGELAGSWDLGVGGSITWVSGSNVYEDALVATLSFRIKDGASGFVPVTVTYDPDDVYNEIEENVAFAVSAGGVSIRDKETPGDTPQPVTDPVTVLPNPGDAAFLVSSAVAGEGESITVTISTVNNPGIASFVLDVSYDPEMLEWTGVSKGSAIAGNWIASVGESLTWVSSDDFKGDDVVAVLTFQALDDAEGASEVTVSYEPDNVYNEREDNVPFAVIPGSVTIVHIHSWSDWTVTPAACTADGSRTRTCSGCGETETEVLKAEGHKAGSPVRENDAAPTCEEDGSYDLAVYCTVCGAELSRETVIVEKLGHDWDEWTTVRKATVFAEGLEERVCRHDPAHSEQRATPKLKPIPGDVNGDGKVTNKDVTRLMKWIKYHTTQEIEVVKGALDVNGDGKINNKDVTRLFRYIKYKNVELCFDENA